MKLAAAFSVLAFGLMVTVRATPALAQDEVEGPSGPPWYTNALGWSLVGVGAASLITGGVLWKL